MKKIIILILISSFLLAGCSASPEMIATKFLTDAFQGHASCALVGVEPMDTHPEFGEMHNVVFSCVPTKVTGEAIDFAIAVAPQKGEVISIIVAGTDQYTPEEFRSDKHASLFHVSPSINGCDVNASASGSGLVSLPTKSKSRSISTNPSSFAVLAISKFFPVNDFLSP